jgi:glutamine synthetase
MGTRKSVTQMIGSFKLRKKEKQINIFESFGINTFSESTMKKHLKEKTFYAFKKWQTHGELITPSQSDEIANAMKNWAISKGATAYTHWFQPMTGLTAEKHDSFITVNGTGQVLETFSGSELIHGEPDASSFPSGGLRATFEARGYSAWDPSSPAFIAEVDLGKTLCIPSIYVSYTGQTLDKKLPLLRSEDVLNKAATDLLKLFGNRDVSMVHSTCGAEQEFFLIDEGFFKLRSDLILIGRTLIGAPSPKDQQLGDQYFGSIKERVLNYMNDVAQQAYKLGIPLATRHNEVAPHQYEFAPAYEASNLAADHNQLLMNIMKKTAKHHGLECLLHEKPFAEINGSGKHLNWSIEDDNGNNLLNPGDTPEDNLQFLTFLVAVIQAVYNYSDLLRASVAPAGNEHRLGGYEAPPAIISVFLGTTISKILDNISKGKIKKISKKDIIKLGIGHLPDIIRDNTDRNRTSPFAFTGNKFEFRTLGSSLNISTPLTVLNTIISDSINTIVSRIKKETKKSEFSSAVLTVLAEIINTCKPILFEGNNYSEEWVKEAEKRGLTNEKSSTNALKSFVARSNIKLFEKYGVFSKAELEARYSIWLDIYNKTLEIEGKTLLDIVLTQILPAANDFQIETGNSLDVLKAMAEDETIPIPIHAVDERKKMFAKLSADIYYIRKISGDLSKMIKYAGTMGSVREAEYLNAELKPHMDHIRHHIDDLESIMPDELWQLPKYREMLFLS